MVSVSYYLLLDAINSLVSLNTNANISDAHEYEIKKQGTLSFFSEIYRRDFSDSGIGESALMNGASM